VSGDGKKWSEVVEEIKGPAVPAGEEEEWEGRLTLPLDIPPTNLGNILNFPTAVGLNYFLQIELGVKSATVEPLTAKIPISIGTVGLLRSRDRLRIQQIQQQIHTHEDACPLSQFSPVMIPHPPRPSCRHCHSSRHIHRRLRQLQRRRRESRKYFKIISVKTNNNNFIHFLSQLHPLMMKQWGNKDKQIILVAMKKRVSHHPVVMKRIFHLKNFLHQRG
jgi:hypothetical protein